MSPRLADVVSLTISGPPRTKKNSRVHTSRGVPLPSTAWTKWRRSARVEWCGGEIVRSRHMVVVHAARYESVLPNGVRVHSLSHIWTPLAEPLNCAATFYRDAERGDLIGFLQGLGDLLEARGVIADDKWLMGFDGSRLALDQEKPRVELELTALEDAVGHRPEPR